MSNTVQHKKSAVLHIERNVLFLFITYFMEFFLSTVAA